MSATDAFATSPALRTRRGRGGGRAGAPAAFAVVASLLLVAVLLPGCASGAEPGVVRLGYFPNITHAQPLYGIQSGLYQEKMGDVQLVPKVFNAGPSAFESLNAGSVDVIYVGPSPTLNALDKQGDFVRIIGGSATGGASFIVREGVVLGQDSDLAGKIFATPQLGNTQDVALKHWLLERGHKPTNKGGEVRIVNAPNADILSMFQSGQIDGAWVPEPWATRLLREAGGIVHAEEASLWEDGRFITTQLVTTKGFLASHPRELGRLLDAHVAATRKLANIGEAERDLINDAIEADTGKRIDDETLRIAMGKVEFSTDPLPAAMEQLRQWSRDIGFLRSEFDLDAAYDLGPLQAAEERAGSPGKVEP